MRIVFVSGSKYNFRSVGVPLLKQFRTQGEVDLYVFNFPEEYSIEPLLEELKEEGLIQSVTLIPHTKHLWQHHRKMAEIVGELSKKTFDFLILPADYMPMHQYFIQGSKKAGAKMIVVEMESPVQTLNSFESGRKRQNVLRRNLFWLKRPYRETRRKLTHFMNYKVVPFLLLGKTFHATVEEHHGIARFATERVDAAVVYSSYVQKAVNCFAPHLPVSVSQHPLYENCRCPNSDQTSKPLLLCLGGPWNCYAANEVEAEALMERWIQFLMKVTAFSSSKKIVVRPHPREKAVNMQCFETRLKQSGIQASFLPVGRDSLPDIVCDYAGVIAPPSCVLVEAAAGCHHVFVLGVQGIENEDVPIQIKAYPFGIELVRLGESLEWKHFKRGHPSAGKLSTVWELLCHLKIKSRPSSAIATAF